MKASVITAITLLGAIAVAQPQRIAKRHQHGGPHHHNNKREIVWETVWDIVTETIDITSTVWVSEGATTTSTTSTTPTPSASQAPAQFFAQTTTTPEPVKPATTFSSVYVAPTTTPEPAPVPSSTYVAPVEPTSTYVAPVEPVTTAVPTTEAAPAATSSASSSGSGSGSSSGYSGTCGSSSPCSGDITFYDTGMGACGWDNDGTTENVVALPVGLMGSQSNGNPFCGMTITVTLNGKKTTAKVVDKCMGCEGDSIDLSHAAFQALADESIGRTTAEWYFN